MKKYLAPDGKSVKTYLYIYPHLVENGYLGNSTLGLYLATIYHKGTS